jgi:hypothetical protein
MKVFDFHVSLFTVIKFNYFNVVVVFQMIFAFIPPPGIAGGWLCFVVSLILIGVLVIIVGDLAGIFGCLGNVLPRSKISIFLVIIANLSVIWPEYSGA